MLRFVFRVRETLSCDSPCVKMRFHVQCEERETVSLTMTCRVFDVCVPNFICVFQNVCQVMVLGWQQRTTRKYTFFSVYPGVRSWKARTNLLDSVLGVLLRSARTLTCITTRLHLHLCTCIYMSKDRSRCSGVTVKPYWKSFRILCHVFIRKMYGLILSTRLEDGMFWSWRCTWILTLNSDFSIPFFLFDSGLNNKNTWERSILFWSGEEDHVNPCISVVWLSRPTVHGTQPPPCVMTTGSLEKNSNGLGSGSAKR
jgi:hypothetical protein